MNKKAYFLTLDAFVAIGIIVVGLSLIYSQHSFKPYEPQGVFYSTDIMDTLASTKIYELNDDGTTFLKRYKAQGMIPNRYNTFFEQAVEFIELESRGSCSNCIEAAKNLTAEVIQNSISDKYSYNITLSNSSDTFILTNVTRTNSFGEKKVLSDSSIVTNSKRIISTIINKSDLVIYTAEVVVWQ